jgi:hypothetical protein
MANILHPCPFFPQATMSLPDPLHHAPRSPGRVRLALLFAIALTACAPDAWRPDAPYDAFLDQVQNHCGEQRIGSRNLGAELLQDAYFLDLTSRFYHGEISRSNYVDSLASAFDASASSAGISCILRLMPGPD